MQPLTSVLTAIGSTLLSCAIAATAQAASEAPSYPNQPIRLIVSFAPGGGTDYLGRLVADRLSAKLGQPIIVENRAGAGSQIGVDAVAKATADGYTLLFGAADGLSVLPALRPNLPYDPLKDFAAIGRIATSSFVISVSPRLKVKSLDELLALAREQPGAVRYGTPGVGSIAHLATALLESETGVQFTHVPYRGGALAVSGFLSNDTDMMVTSVKLIQEVANNGKAAMMAQTALSRLPSVAELPTVDQAGVKGYDVVSWFGLFAPAGTPQAAIDRLTQAAAEITSEPDFQQRMIEAGNASAYLPPAEFARFIEQDKNKWMGVVKAAGIQEAK